MLDAHSSYLEGFHPVQRGQPEKPMDDSISINVLSIHYCSSAFMMSFHEWVKLCSGIRPVPIGNPEWVFIIGLNTYSNGAITFAVFCHPFFFAWPWKWEGTSSRSSRRCRKRGAAEWCCKWVQVRENIPQLRVQITFQSERKIPVWASTHMLIIAFGSRDAIGLAEPLSKRTHRRKSAQCRARARHCTPLEWALLLRGLRVTSWECPLVFWVVYL